MLVSDTDVPAVYEELRSARVQNARRSKFKDLGDMLGETRTLLSMFYRHHNQRLAKLLNDDKFTWEY